MLCRFALPLPESRNVPRVSDAGFVILLACLSEAFSSSRSRETSD